MAEAKTYLIAHTDLQGCNVAQAKIQAKTETDAREQFKELYPQRQIKVTGVFGKV